MKMTLSGRLLNPTAAEFVPSLSLARSLSSSLPAAAPAPEAAANADGASASAQSDDAGSATPEHIDKVAVVSDVVAASADQTIGTLEDLCASADLLIPAVAAAGGIPPDAKGSAA